MEETKLCAYVDSCELFPVFQMESILKFWQVRYCFGKYTRCARYELVRTGKPVPLTLLPSGKHLDAVPSGER